MSYKYYLYSKLIERHVCKKYGIPITHLKHKTRKQEIARCRHIIYYIAKILDNNISFERIANRYNQKRLDAYNGYKSISEISDYWSSHYLVTYYRDLKEEINELIDAIKKEYTLTIPKLREYRKNKQREYVKDNPQRYKKHLSDYKKKNLDRYLKYLKSRYRKNKDKNNPINCDWVNNCIQL